MQAQSATEITQIAIEFKKHAPRGFILDANNGGQIQAYLAAKGLPISIETIAAAIETLKYTLDWEKGFAPVPVTAARDTRSQTQKAHDAGISSYQREGTHADTSESGWARDIRLGREANASRLATKKRDEQRYRETHQTVMTANGRISYTQSEVLNKAAAQRHAEEDARESGRPVTVAKGFRVIPADETDFSKYEPEELKAHLARKKSGGRKNRIDRSATLPIAWDEYQRSFSDNGAALTKPAISETGTPKLVFPCLDSIIKLLKSRSAPSLRADSVSQRPLFIWALVRGLWSRKFAQGDCRR